MILDSSALLAILFNVPEKESFLEAMKNDPYVKMSVANYLESAIRIDSFRDPILSRIFDDLVEEIGIELIEVTPAQAAIARQAFRDFGKGSGHPASLNFGDCFAYALTKVNKEKLLFKGKDFPETDIISVLKPYP